MKLEEAINKLKEMKENCRYTTYVPNEQRDEWKEERQAIDIVLKELDKKDKVIDLVFEKWFELDTVFFIRLYDIHSKEELKEYFYKQVEVENVKD